MKLLVFDSGVGGLSIFDAVRARLPGLAIDYVSDNAAFPYGTKTESELVQRVSLVLHVLEKKLAPDLIVVACNTASTVALPKIRDTLQTSVVGVVPAIKPAAERSRSKIVGLLATPGTVARDYTRQLIDEFAAHCEVISVGSSELVQIAEAKLYGANVSAQDIRAILAPFAEHQHAANMDIMILGCTHFPLLIDELKVAFFKPVEWIDSGAAIAARVESMLQLKPQASNDSLNTKYCAYFTAQDSCTATLQDALRSMQISDCGYIQI
ncbi:MAG: glutamate racemase [Pseudomonadales bacterium]